MQKPGMGLILGSGSSSRWVQQFSNTSSSGSSNNATRNPDPDHEPGHHDHHTSRGKRRLRIQQSCGSSWWHHPVHLQRHQPARRLIDQSRDRDHHRHPRSSTGTASATIKVTDSTQPSSQSTTSNLSIKINPGHPGCDHHLPTRRYSRNGVSIDHPASLGRRAALHMGISLRNHLARRVEPVAQREHSPGHRPPRDPIR